jgi:hypothetical protein
LGHGLSIPVDEEKEKWRRAKRGKEKGSVSIPSLGYNERKERPYLKLGR